ncbi:hypothetical protein K8I85_09820 [bacterium]|nr:hypothetical protein [bacterium]
MVESSDLQSAIQRTQAMEKVASLQNQQEELNRKRFELELARESAEKAKKARNVAGAEKKRVIRDRYDGDGGSGGDQPAPDEEGDEVVDEQAQDNDGDDQGGTPPVGGTLDVRV